MQNYKLTKEQQKNITSTLRTNDIDLQEPKLSRLCFHIEIAWQSWDAERRRRWQRMIGKSELLREDKRIKKFLESMHPTVKTVLSQCAEFTPMKQRVRETGYAGAMEKALSENYSSDDDWDIVSLQDVGLQILTESCAVALSDEATGLWIDQTAIDDHATQRGRQLNTHDIELVKELRQRFELFTGKRASTSETGAFLQFVSTIFEIISPRSTRRSDCKDNTNRDAMLHKLIRKVITSQRK